MNKTQRMEEVLREFVEDVQSAYTHEDGMPDEDISVADWLRIEWPDLAITYEKALAVLEHTA